MKNKNLLALTILFSTSVSPLTVSSDTIDTAIEKGLGTYQVKEENINSNTAVQSTYNNVSLISSELKMMESNNIAGGIFGTCEWYLTEEGTLYIEGGEFPSTITNPKVPWQEYESNIQKIVLEGEIVLGGNCYGLFSLPNLESIGNSNFLNTSQVTVMTGMFSNCYNLKSLNLSSFDTSNVVSMNDMFASCRSLTSLDLSSFDTSNTTTFVQMFSYCEGLTNLNVSSFNTEKALHMSNMFAMCEAFTEIDVSSFNTSNVTRMDGMFNYCQSLTELDLSSFDTSNVTTMDRALQAVPLHKLILSADTKLLDNVRLSAPVSDDKYTGKWINVGKGTDSNPEGNWIGNSEDLYLRTSNKIEDTYVWQAKAGEVVTVKYVDEDGEKIAESRTLTGNIGASYEAEQLDISGYTFKEVQGETQGEYTDQAQTVTFIYAKDDITAAPVIITYINDLGEEIAESKILTGTIGEAYEVEHISINGYHFKEARGNEKGIFSKESQSVIEIYEEDEKAVIPEDEVNEGTNLDDKTVGAESENTDENQNGVEKPQTKYSFISSQKGQVSTASINKTLPETGERKSLRGYVVGIFSLLVALVLLRFKNSSKTR